MAKYIANYNVSWTTSWSEEDHFSGSEKSRVQRDSYSCTVTEELPRINDSRKAFTAAMSHLKKIAARKKEELLAERRNLLYASHTTLDVKLLGIERLAAVELPKNLPSCRKEF